MSDTVRQGSAARGAPPLGLAGIGLATLLFTLLLWVWRNRRSLPLGDEFPYSDSPPE